MLAAVFTTEPPRHTWTFLHQNARQRRSATLDAELFMPRKQSFRVCKYGYTETSDLPTNLCTKNSTAATATRLKTTSINRLRNNKNTVEPRPVSPICVCSFYMDIYVASWGKDAYFWNVLKLLVSASLLSPLFKSCNCLQKWWSYIQMVEKGENIGLEIVLLLSARRF